MYFIERFSYLLFRREKENELPSASSFPPKWSKLKPKLGSLPGWQDSNTWVIIHSLSRYMSGKLDWKNIQVLTQPSDVGCQYCKQWLKPQSQSWSWYMHLKRPSVPKLPTTGNKKILVPMPLTTLGEMEYCNIMTNEISALSWVTLLALWLWVRIFSYFHLQEVPGHICSTGVFYSMVLN